MRIKRAFYSFSLYIVIHFIMLSFVKSVHIRPIYPYKSPSVGKQTKIISTQLVRSFDSFPIGMTCDIQSVIQ